MSSLIELGAALELHHQSLLVHDDVTDHDTIRNGYPNIIGTYQQDSGISAATAMSIGLLSGNILGSLAHRLIMNAASIEPVTGVRLLRVLTEANLSVNYGQQLDIISVMPPKTQFDNERIRLTQQLKTASYTTLLPIRFAAELLQLNQFERQLLDSFAERFGVLYQLYDDYTDYFPESFAEAPALLYGDFREAKITYPLWFALQRASEADKAFLLRHAGQVHISEADLQRVLDIMHSCGAHTESHKQLDRQYRQVVSSLHALALSAADYEVFHALIKRFRPDPALK